MKTNFLYNFIEILVFFYCNVFLVGFACSAHC